MDKELKKSIIAYFKAQGLKFKYSTGTSKNPYFTVRFPITPECLANHRLPLKFIGEFSAKDRNMALDAIYGQDFKRNAENPSAGNVRSHDISMQESNWRVFMANEHHYYYIDNKLAFVDSYEDGNSCEGFNFLYQ